MPNNTPTNQEARVPKDIINLLESEKQSDPLRVLKDKIEQLAQARVSQAKVEPDAIKQRHMAEGNRFIRAGLEANLPTRGENVAPNSTAFYFCTDTFKLKIWTGSLWKSVTLT